MALYDSENNRLLDTNDNVLLARATFTVGTREVKKIYVGENEVKAIYIGDNLVYEKPISLPQLSAPVISLSEDTLTIEEVENAEYYDIYADGVLKESVDARPTTLISFTIIDSYSASVLQGQAEEGMTWAEWVDSEYNTGGFTNNGTYILTETGQYAIADNVGQHFVSPNDVITANYTYKLSGGFD